MSTLKEQLLKEFLKSEKDKRNENNKLVEQLDALDLSNITMVEFDTNTKPTLH